MSSLDHLFRKRAQLDRIRQPEYKSWLDRLDAEIPPGKTPFGRETEISQALSEVPGYRDGPTGGPARVENLRYLYRLSSVSGIVKFCDWDSGRRPINTRVVHRMLMVETNYGENWVDLAKFAQGELSSYRKASFWTLFALRRHDIVRDMAKSGMASDWILKRSVIIRLDLQQLLARGLSVTVPTAVDAYTYPIFRPRRTSRKPAWGRTIDVGQNPPRIGLKEVVVPPAPVSLFTMKPVLIPGQSKIGVVKDLIDLVESLEEYYASLLKEVATKAS